MDSKGSKKKRNSINSRKEKYVIPTPRPKAKEEKKESVRKWYFYLTLIIVVTLISYLNCLTNQFVFDDVHIILNNPTIKGIEKIPRLLGMGKSRVSYRPMRMVSYAVDYTLNKKLWRSAGGYKGGDKGLNPFGYHISNCIYHIVTSFLVFLVLYRLVANYRVAFLAATLFALHPVHTDSVSYIAGRRDILFTIFYLAGFYLFLRYRQTYKTKFIVVSLLSYLLSLGSKEMGVTLPVLFLCYDLVENFTGRVRKINFIYFKELMLALKKVMVQSKYLYSFTFLGALAYSYYKIFIRSPSHQSSYYGDSVLTTFLTVGKVLVYYMRLLLYPIKLNADYSYNAFPLSSSFFEPATFFSFIVLGVVGYIVLRLLVDDKMLAFGVIWFFVTLLPVCQIFPHHELLAEHYLYLPSFGFCLILALLVNSFLEEKRYLYFTYAIFMTVILLFSLRIVDRNRDWRNRLTFWEKTVKTVPQCARAHLSLGVFYVEEEELDKAISEYKQAIAIEPRFAMAYYNLGNVYTQKGMINEAISEYKRALILKPRYAEAHNNLGVAYGIKGRLDEAISEHRRAIIIKPRFVEAHYNLGNDYLRRGMLDEAISEYKRVLAIQPRYAKGHNSLALTYLKKKQYQLAIKHWDKALELGYKVNPAILRSLLPYR